MKRLGNISQAVETLQNFREAFFDFSRHKKSRLSVQAFEAEFETNLQALLNAYVHQTWHTSDYEAKPVEKPKHRIVNKLPVGDHVRKTGQLDEHGDEIEEPVWQPESWWLFTGSDILVDQARKEWELLEKGFYTVAAELTNKFGKKFYKFI